MYVSVYLEIDENGRPVFGERLKDTLQSAEARVICSPEYEDLVEDSNKNQVEIIPMDLLTIKEGNLAKKKDRSFLLQILDINGLTEWFDNYFELNQVDFVLTEENYISLEKVLKDRNIPSYIHSNSDGNNAVSFLRTELEQAEQQVADMQKQIVTNGETIKSLREGWNSSEAYLKNLQEHATNLDNELKKYKDWFYKGEDGQKKIEEYEKKYEQITALYKGVVDEMDQLKIENLNLKKKRR